MSTLTLESALGWRYGDGYFFLDFSRGDFADGPTGRHRLFAQLAPRLSLSEITGREIASGGVSDVLLAAKLDRGGSGFAASMIGIGVDLEVPGVPLAQMALYHRHDSFNGNGYQLSAVWGAPVSIGALELTLAGFADIATSDSGTDVMAQPQLLLDLGALAGRSGKLHAGLEWYLHRTPGPDASVPQGMLRWSW